MRKYLVRIKTFAGKAFGWMRTHAGILSGMAALVILAIALLKIFSMENLSLDAQIQAALMVLLIAITLFYAWQTHRLVLEERRALKAETDERVAEYGEKRITQFLKPLKDKLQQLKEGLSIITNQRSGTLIDQWDNLISPIKYVLFDGVKKFYIENAYMSNDMLQEKIFQFFDQIESSWPTIDNQDGAYTIPWKKKMEEAIGFIDFLVGFEIQLISTHIKKTYRYYVNVPISWDSLLPPKDPPE